MRDANENDPLHPGIRVEDQCPLNHMLGGDLGIEPIRVTLKNVIPEDASGRYRLHLGEQSAHAVAK
jgi:hypothetical protein